METLKTLPRGRKLVLAAIVVALAFLGGFLVSGKSFYYAFTHAGVATLLFLGVGGLAQSLWGGGEVEEVEGAGWRVKLANATRRPIRVLEKRVDSQMTQVNDRLFDLERVVFKDRPPKGQAGTER